MWYVCDVCLLFYYCIYWTSSLLIKILKDKKLMINMSHLKISRDYSWPPKFSEKNGQYISIIFLCTLSKMFQFVEIVVLLTKI